MKRLILPLHLIIILLVISCEKPQIPSGINRTDGGDEANLVVTVYQLETVLFPVSSTRAEISQFCTRLNFAVYDSLNVRVDQVNQQVGDKDFGVARFSLDPGRYRVVVVAHNSNGHPTMTNPAQIQFKNNQGFSDTFIDNDTVTVSDTEGTTLSVQLNRIASMCRFVITDSIPQGVAQMRFLYKGGSGAFDASTGLGSVNSTQIESFPVEAGQDSTSFDLYTYLHDTEGTIHLQATAYDADNNVVRDHEFDVPLKRRMITKFSGPYFSGSSTSSSGITIVIGIDAEWEGEQEITY